ncbi:hypothetical protein POVWA1_026120 [Plasmodium ovale wallikeri]|uniref:Uncharacterized protein n=1 Tax=Plasmodium ovale wallikeri TaxID=864142 RepID=A0A1A8YU50_PLAOA|nr:hypothetical protein POVWA1_026120 [Plasmodium ovale wallikeri]
MQCWQVCKLGKGKKIGKLPNGAYKIEYKIYITSLGGKKKGKLPNGAYKIEYKIYITSLGGKKKGKFPNGAYEIEYKIYITSLGGKKKGKLPNGAYEIEYKIYITSLEGSITRNCKQKKGGPLVPYEMFHTVAHVSFGPHMTRILRLVLLPSSQGSNPFNLHNVQKKVLVPRFDAMQPVLPPPVLLLYCP